MKKLKAGKRRQPALRKGRKKKPPPVRRQIGQTPPPSAVPAPGSDILNEAALALQAGRPSAALSHCQAALATDSGNSEALNLAGIALFQLGEAKQALSMLETAVAYHPDHIDALNNLGNVRKTLGWLTEAEAAYRRALEVDPGYVNGHFNLGIVYELMGRFAAAEAAYRRCIAARPAFAEAHFNLANVMKALGRLDEARQSYRLALDLDAALVFEGVHRVVPVGAGVAQEGGDLERILGEGAAGHAGPHRMVSWGWFCGLCGFGVVSFRGSCGGGWACVRVVRLRRGRAWGRGPRVGRGVPGWVGGRARGGLRPGQSVFQSVAVSKASATR